MRPLTHLFVSIGFLGVAKADLAGDLAYGIQGAASCAGCHALLLPLKFLATFGDGPFVSAITAVCKALKVVDPDVCDGAIRLQGPILANDLRSIDPLGHTATKLCDALFGLCQPPAVNPYTVPFPKPTPQFTQTRGAQAVMSTRAPPFHVVHFSDVHVDRQYTPGSDANCTKPICCRPYADKSGPVAVAAGPMGNHNCDTPPLLARRMLDAIAANNKFSIFTGDVSEASVWLANEKDTAENIDVFTKEMAEVLGAPVYSVIGNHESAPTNSFPRNTTTKSNSQWVFDTVSQGWASLMDPAAAEQAKVMSGSYSTVVPGTKLRIISLNTVYWYKNNYWLYDSDQLQPDPNGIIGFLVQELQAAEDAGQKAWILGHMPPGSHDALRDQSNYFDQVVQRYKHTISGQFYGHTHQDGFVLSYSDYEEQTMENAVSVGWVAPAITPRGGNPAFKIYTVDPDTYEIIDARVFRADLSMDSFQVEPTWELYYSAREVYGAFIDGGWPEDEPLTPQFWHKVTEAFEDNDDAFRTYLSFLKRGLSVPECDGECKRTAICGIRAMRAENNCATSKPGLSFRRRDLDSDTPKRLHIATDPEDCEGTDIGKILTKVVESLETPEDFLHVEAILRQAIPSDESYDNGASD